MANKPTNFPNQAKVLLEIDSINSGIPQTLNENLFHENNQTKENIPSSDPKKTKKQNKICLTETNLNLILQHHI